MLAQQLTNRLDGVGDELVRGGVLRQPLLHGLRQRQPPLRKLQLQQLHDLLEALSDLLDWLRRYHPRCERQRGLAFAVRRPGVRPALEQGLDAVHVPIPGRDDESGLAFSVRRRGVRPALEQRLDAVHVPIIDRVHEGGPAFAVRPALVQLLVDVGVRLALEQRLDAVHVPTPGRDDESGLASAVHRIGLRPALEQDLDAVRVPIPGREDERGGLAGLLGCSSGSSGCLEAHPDIHQQLHHADIPAFSGVEQRSRARGLCRGRRPFLIRHLEKGTFFVDFATPWDVGHRFHFMFAVTKIKILP